MTSISPNSAYRTISLTQRPFSGLDGFENCVQAAELAINGQKSEGQNIYLEASRWIQDPLIQFRFELDVDRAQTAATSAQLETQDLLFNVSVRGSFLKEIATVRSENLFDLLASGGVLNFEVAVNEHPLIFNDSFGGFDVVFAIVIGRNLAPSELHPSDVGTWLTQDSILVQPTRSRSQFRTLPMSQEMKSEFQIPTAAATFVEIRESIATAENLDSAATLFIDEDLYSYLNDQGRTAVSRQIMMSIVVDFFMTLIGHAVQRLAQDINHEAGESVSPLPEASVLHFLLTRLAQNSGTSMEFFLKELISNPQILRSYLEAHYNELDGALQMLKEERIS